MSIKIKPGVMKVRKNGEMVDVGMPVYTREFEQETDGRLDAVESSLSGLQETVAGKQNTLTDADKQAIADLSEVTVTQTVTSGTEIGEVNGTKLYAPDSGMPITVINQDGTMTAADLHELEDGLYFAENAIQLMGHGGWDAVGIVQIVFGGYVVSLGVAYSGFDEEDGVYTLANSADGYGANERDNDDYLIEDPGNGEDGQVLTLTEDGYAWTDVACGVKVVKVIENAGVYSFENGEDDFAVIQDNFPNVILHLSTEYYSPVSFTTGIAYQFARINSTEASVINVFSSGSITRFAKQLVSVGTNLLDGQIPVFSDMNGNFYASSLKKINGQSVIGSGNITIATDVHANQTVLDGITAEKVTSWDSKQDALTDDDKQAIADLHEDPDLSGYVTKEYTDTDIPAHTLDWLVENYPDYCKMTSDTTYVLYLYPGVNIPNGVYVATKYCTFGVRYKLVDSDGVETEKVLTIQLPATWFRYSKVTYQNGAVTHVYESAGKLHFVYMKADGTTTAETNSTVFEYRLADYAKTADLATVATSGSYNDLSDKPEEVTVTQTVTSGTEIGKVDGTALYAPEVNYVDATLDDDGYIRFFGGNDEAGNIGTEIAQIQSNVSGKQDKLIVGSGISIAEDGKTISAVEEKIEFISDVTLEEDVVSYTVNLNGHYKKVMIIQIIKNTMSSGSPVFNVGGGNIWLGSRNTTNKACVSFEMIDDNIMKYDYHHYGNGTNTRTGGYSDRCGKDFEQVVLSTSTGTDVLYAGGTIKVYGVKV